MEKIDELKKDIAELETLAKAATRQKCKDILSIEIRKLVTEVVNMEEARKNTNGTAQTNNTPSNAPSSSSSALPKKRYQEKISNYAWDQSDNFVKFYITLKNVQNIPTENVTCSFDVKSANLVVKDLDNKDYSWQIKQLLKEIDPAKSSWKVKTDTVLINAAKKSSGNWSHLTEWEKKASESKAPKLDSSDKMDPTEGLMSLMKNMYDSGDDEMKRTIAKAWTESQQKKGQDFL
ncbi:unnamed protein product [Phyllotreta striolata]|uniref:Calcyclin-binding protein n=1 Tax=Phyllotreta striolata TaxID=444603 RepID=A0A9N9TE28_PHYSR|nr:unnamed protein product [Phyllotreta striolata]